MNPALGYARWYRKAAEQGDAVAQHMLGSMYYWGNGELGKDIEPSSFIFNGPDSFSFTCSSLWRPWNNSDR